MGVKYIGQDHEGRFKVELSLNSDGYIADSLNEIRKMVHEEIDEMLTSEFEIMLEEYMMDKKMAINFRSINPANIKL